jgi:carbon storage regulator CsrA
MLVLTRRLGERIQLGENISITVVRISDSSVRIGVEAPLEMQVTREELLVFPRAVLADQCDHAGRRRLNSTGE